MEEDLLIETRELNDYRIKVYYDTDPMCPCTDWDLAGLFLWEYTGSSSLHSKCNYKNLFGDVDNFKYSLNDALKELASLYVPQKKFIEYINKHLDSLRFRYDRSTHLWYLEEYHTCEYNGSHWLKYYIFTPDEVKDTDIRGELSRHLKKEDFIYLLSSCQKEIAFYEWSSTGYCQGDYVEGIAYCTKERFIEMVEGNTKRWRERAVSLMEPESECIGMYLWGNVKRWVLQKKQTFKKVYDNTDKKDEYSFEWETIESCGGYFEDTEEVIKNVIAEFNLEKENIA